MLSVTGTTTTVESKELKIMGVIMQLLYTSHVLSTFNILHIIIVNRKIETYEENL